MPSLVGLGIHHPLPGSLAAAAAVAGPVVGAVGVFDRAAVTVVDPGQKGYRDISGWCGWSIPRTGTRPVCGV